MARIAGVDIPREKRLVISLTYVFGIGRTRAEEICEATGIDQSTRVRDLTDEEINKVRSFIVQNL
jgi:small subunit ribosomal protein S13